MNMVISRKLLWVCAGLSAFGIVACSNLWGFETLTGSEADAGDGIDANPLTDVTPSADSSTDASPAVDASLDASTAKDAAPDSSWNVDAGPEPICAPLGYKPCAAPNSKCEIAGYGTPNPGTATCVVPGLTLSQGACVTDSDCGKDELCATKLCRSLCEVTASTPWGVNQNTWASSSCAGCPNGSGGGGMFHPTFLPSWLGACVD